MAAVEGVLVGQLQLGRAQHHEAFFCDLLNRIPQHLVLPPTEQEEETAAAQYWHHRKVALPKDEKKKLAREGKRARFDPANQKSVEEMQDSRHRVQAREAQPAPDAEDGSVERNSYDALRDRLQQRIANFRSKRNNKEPGTSKRAIARREAQAEAAAGGATDRARPGWGNLHKGSGREGGATEESEGGGAAVAHEPKIADTGDIQFAMLELGAKSARKKAPAPGSKVRKLESMLEVAKQKEKRLQELRQSDVDKATGEQWKDVLKMATGDKVVDDPTRLKRALKQREAAKKKSAKKWDRINKDVVKQKMAKQIKRTENLKKRSGQLPKDDPAAKKRRQSGAGFEGRKSGGGFINKPGPAASK